MSSLLKWSCKKSLLIFSCQAKNLKSLESMSVQRNQAYYKGKNDFCLRNVGLSLFLVT